MYQLRDISFKGTKTTLMVNVVVPIILAFVVELLCEKATSQPREVIFLLRTDTLPLKVFVAMMPQQFKVVQARTRVEGVQFPVRCPILERALAFVTPHRLLRSRLDRYPDRQR